MVVTVKMCLKLSLLFVVCLNLPPSYSIRLDRNTSESTYVHSPGGLESIEKVIERKGFNTPEECSRTCKNNEKRSCYYRFHLERYSVMGRACEVCTSNNTLDCQCVVCDGHERAAFTVNRQIPGPTIDVCEGDTVYIDVVNLIPESAVTIHWHGILQFNTSHYDGVPYVSQCPILPGNSFRYVWKADNPGTHFWHSHTGLQKIDGLSGAIIIRQPKNREAPNLYDEDQHVLFLLDWAHHYLDHNFPGNRFTDVGQRPVTLLINGKGKFQNATNDEYSNVEVFNVQPGRRYRFRYINAAASVCPMQLFVEQHPMLVIATDGHFIKPVTVDSIISASAERFDFVITTNNAKGSYWVYAKSREDCAVVQADQIAILRYAGSPLKPQRAEPTYDNSLPSTKVLNPMDSYCNYTRDDAICISQLNFTKHSEIPKIILGNVTTQIRMSFRVGLSELNTFKPHTYSKHLVSASGRVGAGMINNISYEAPPSPLTSQYNDVDSRHFCKMDNLPNNCSTLCKCTHMVNISLNSVVELILVDEVNAIGIHHPFHLHGFAFHVMSSKTLYPERASLRKVMDMDSRGEIKRRQDETPPLKDTIMIPSHGFVVLRFLANNPGFWFIHCHFLLHLVTGMEAVIQVGSIDEMQETPYKFPKCGHYKEDV